MPDDDVLEEGGLEPADDETTDVGVADAPAPAPDPEPESYTREQLAELLGPRFERFASHAGEEAFRQYGQAYDNATGLIRQGAHLEPQDPSVYEKIGLDPSEIQQAPAEEAPGIYGVPWAEPTAWDEINQLANSESMDHKRTAAMAVLKLPDAPEEYKRAYFDNWAGQGQYDVLSYQQQAIMAAQQQSLQEVREQTRAEFEAQYGPIQQKHVAETIDAMIARAQAEIPGFTEHKAGIVTLMQEREQRYPGYTERFNSASLDERVAELDELTTIAAKRFAPQRKAANAQAVSDADDAKRRQVTETGRTSGAPETEAQALKRRSVEDAKRVGGRVY